MLIDDQDQLIFAYSNYLVGDTVFSQISVTIVVDKFYMGSPNKEKCYKVMTIPGVGGKWETFQGLFSRCENSLN